MCCKGIFISKSWHVSWHLSCPELQLLKLLHFLHCFCVHFLLLILLCVSEMGFLFWLFFAVSLRNAQFTRKRRDQVTCLSLKMWKGCGSVSNKMCGASHLKVMFDYTKVNIYYQTMLLNINFYFMALFINIRGGNMQDFIFSLISAVLHVIMLPK